MKEEIIKKLIETLNNNPASLKVPTWAIHTKFIRIGWFKKVRVWTGSFPRINDVRLTDKEYAPLKKAIENALLQKTYF